MRAAEYNSRKFRTEKKLLLFKMTCKNIIGELKFLFYALSQNCKKRLLASPCLPVLLFRLSVSLRGTDFKLNLMFEALSKIFREI